MLEPNTDLSEAAVKPPAGTLLKQAREAKGLSRETVAKQLNLLLSQVIALEENEFARFPGETFVRGHLRSYARLLDLDANALIDAYRGATADKQASLLTQSSIKWRPVSLEQKPHRWRRYSGLAATALVLFALWGWQQHRDKAQRLSLTADNGEAHELAGGIDSALSSGTDNALLDSVQLMPNTQSSQQSSAPANANSSSTDNVASVPAQTSEIDKLSLRFTADCWIEIKDRDNKLIVATLKHAEENLQIEGRGPFKVLLGYAPGVSMAYNGTPVKVDVSEGTRSTRLIVGSS